MQTSLLSSLLLLDPQYPEPETVSILRAQPNHSLLEHVASDAFGAHIFPGNLKNFSRGQFFAELNTQLGRPDPVHLWVNLPVCERRCFFCQFPLTVARNPETRNIATQKWLDANIREARLWLQAVPNLRTATIGEFNILGGTPTLFSNEQLEQLMRFYRDNFNFKCDTSIRIEGTASTMTYDKLSFLKDLGINKVSSGIQSFDNGILRNANCAHSRDDAISYIKNAHELKFDSVNADFIYGLLDQSVSQFLADIELAIELQVSCIVITKLHLKTFNQTRTAVSGEKEALWQIPASRQALQDQGHHWPSLGVQYQMREEAVRLLTKHGYREHPTMYFYHPDKTPEKWKSLMVDQDKQFAEIGLGMGGSSSNMRSEAVNSTTSASYFKALENNQVPVESIRGFDDMAVRLKSIQMALSSCQPLDDREFRRKFAMHSIFDPPFGPVFHNLAERQLVSIDETNRQIYLTAAGKTLVEAIIHNEFKGHA